MKNTHAFWMQNGPALALIPALAAMFGSLYYSEFAHFVPCTLCWYQRILMYPLVLIIGIGLIKQDEFLPDYVLPFSLLGMGLAFYHYLVQLGVFPPSSTCAAGGVPCDGRYISYLGFVTIPFLSLIAFTLISGAMGMTKWAQMNYEEA